DCTRPDQPARLRSDLRARPHRNAGLLRACTGIPLVAPPQRPLVRVPDRLGDAGAGHPWRALRRPAAGAGRAVGAACLPRSAADGGGLRGRAGGKGGCAGLAADRPPLRPPDDLLPRPGRQRHRDLRRDL
ncbi:MAG: hypothetical protein AVDCRST_MAG27-1274, partial [uncultured Craurococcus sp.]